MPKSKNIVTSTHWGNLGIGYGVPLFILVLAIFFRPVSTYESIWTIILVFGLFGVYASKPLFSTLCVSSTDLIIHQFCLRERRTKEVSLSRIKGLTLDKGLFFQTVLSINPSKNHDINPFDIDLNYPVSKNSLSDIKDLALEANLDLTIEIDQREGSASNP